MTSPASSNYRARSGAGRGFTVLEVLTAMAFLGVVLGLMVSLARYVRSQSAQQYTRHLLAELDDAQRLYASPANIGTAAPPATSFADAPPDASSSAAAGSPPSVLGPGMALPADPSEADVRALVEKSNGPFVAGLLARVRPGDNQTTVRDAWGNPIGFLPSQNPHIGMARQNQPFFFSAGPDGRYLTRQDNLYSYEQITRNSFGDESLDTANNDPPAARSPAMRPLVERASPAGP